MFFHGMVKLLHWLCYPTVRPSQRIEILVDGLSTLLPHQPKSNVPLPQPGDHMRLKHVHLGQYTSRWTGTSVEVHELCDFLLCILHNMV